MIFYWCAGQDDNIGDVILRRRMLRAVQDTGRACHVYVGRATPGFVEGLSLRRDDVVYRNFIQFVMVALLASLRREWLFAFNPGEIRCTRRQGIMHAILIPMMLVSHLRGRRCVRLGVGVHEYESMWKFPILVTVWLSKENVWRDSESRDRFGMGTVAPDWAFDEGSELSESADLPRRWLAMSLRSDSPEPSDEWFAAMEQISEAKGLEPIVVVQVRRDSLRARAISERLQCSVVDWTGESHHAQEQRLRNVYRESEAVVSDRLHVLIMALTEGAIPLGLMEHEDSKIGRHFRAAGFETVSWDVSDWTSAEITQQGMRILDDRRSVEAASRFARDRVDAMDMIVGVK
ncbi:polysaccharide pyruvyl transferase family protein [Prescottella soli]|uniref:Polysaccharide pyruvyl transferase domain-containing protein n=1 Tax=Prescottella soli TaxID=1543852 RepID=A0ABW9FZH8_9NOCA